MEEKEFRSKKKSEVEESFRKKGTLLFGAFALGSFSLVFFGAPQILPLSYNTGDGNQAAVSTSTPSNGNSDEKEDDGFKPIYLPTPEPLKAIYMSQCVAGTPSFRERLVKLIEETELNSVIIDVKDYTGKIGFPTNNPKLKESVSDQCGARDMREFVKMLNERGIYTIARITVFQDPYYTHAYPELAVKKESDKNAIWKDYKGLSFIDVGSKPFWDYIVEISKETYKIGFDELNYDYIRFPSDGPMRDIYYPFSDEKLARDPDYGKANVLKEFFAYLDKEMENTGAVLSADIFGMTTTNYDDLNIGQVLEYAEPHFDYIAPMVYPSHYPSGFIGLSNPNSDPYKVIHYSMSRAVERLTALTTPFALVGEERIGTSTPAIYSYTPKNKLKLRPWLQDFDYGGDYDVEEVRAQMQATYDAGLTSWMLWDPSNRYTRGALQNAEE
ncbi:MAG: putative glycoside hydrolase [Candidatus Paceibacterota bacterium]